MANAQERELHYPLGDTLPEPGATIELAPGVRWLRMRLPFALDLMFKRQLDLHQTRV